MHLMKETPVSRENVIFVYKTLRKFNKLVVNWEQSARESLVREEVNERER